MKPSLLQQLMLYRFRYLIGFGLYLVALTGLLVADVGRVPAGLNQAGINNAIISSGMSFSLNTNMINAPYHFLQQLSMNLLGLSPFSIKLPSLVIGFICGILLLLLLRRWFNDNVAIITSLIMVSGSLFLSAGRSGTAAIMLIFWSLLILLIGSLIVQQSKGQLALKLFSGVVLGLMLYTPLMIYILLAGIIAALIHPHSRYILRNLGTGPLVGIFLLATILLAPLGWAFWQNPSLSLELLLIPEKFPSLAEFGNQALALLMSIGGFFAPSIGEYIKPAFSVVALLIITLGFLKLVFDHHALRTYVLLIWLAIILPLLVFTPDSLTIIFVPFTLLLATGIQTLIREWYSIFPRNPYARLAGLVPLVVLVGGIGFFNYNNYFSGYRYAENVTTYYNNDLALLKDTLNQDTINKKRITLLLPDNDATSLEFYSLLTKEYPLLSVAPATEIASLANQKGTTVTGEAVEGTTTLGAPTQLVVNAHSKDSLRWRVFTKW